MGLFDLFSKKKEKIEEIPTVESLPDDFEELKKMYLNAIETGKSEMYIHPFLWKMSDMVDDGLVEDPHMQIWVENEYVEREYGGIGSTGHYYLQLAKELENDFFFKTNGEEPEKDGYGRAYTPALWADDDYNVYVMGYEEFCRFFYTIANEAIRLFKMERDSDTKWYVGFYLLKDMIYVQKTEDFDNPIFNDVEPVLDNIRRYGQAYARYEEKGFDEEFEEMQRYAKEHIQDFENAPEYKYVKEFEYEDDDEEDEE